jgi:UDP-glucose 4-epimerase
MSVLITGGAGYIGAHVVRLLRERGDSVVVVDDLLGGKEDRVEGVPLVRLDLVSEAATSALEQIIRDHSVDSVVHLAARKQAGESVERAAWYYQQNVGGLANLLLAMERTGVQRLVFSSSAAVYGSAVGRLVESSETRPLNPYGETKLAGEWLVDAATRSFPLRAISLRYFNVAGAGWPELGDRAALNLVPMVFERIDAGESPLIFGDDYDTPDGTCIRDYVHVLDLALAHLASLDQLEASLETHRVYNVGGGTGSSVKQVVAEILAVSGSALIPKVRPRRPGDPAVSIAVPDRIRAELGWVATRDLREIIASAWASHEHFAAVDS